MKIDSKLHELDLNEVCGWIGAHCIEEIETRFVNVPISEFIDQIKEMESTYDEFPNDEKRSKDILEKLKTNGAQPVYIEDGDKTLVNYSPLKRQSFL